MRSRSTESSDSPGSVSNSNCSPLHENSTRCPVPLTARQDRGMPPAPLPPGALSRRAFLGGALGAAGGLVVAGSFPALAVAADDPYFTLLLSSDLAASPNPQRMVFALGKGKDFASGPSVTVRFRKKGTKTWAQPQRPAFDRAGLPKGRGVYVSRPVLDSPGTWQ